MTDAPPILELKNVEASYGPFRSLKVENHYR